MPDKVLNVPFVQIFPVTLKPTHIYLLEVNYENTRAISEIDSKLIMKIPERRHWIWANFKQVNVGWWKVLQNTWNGLHNLMNNFHQCQTNFRQCQTNFPNTGVRKMFITIKTKSQMKK